MIKQLFSYKIIEHKMELEDCYTYITIYHTITLKLPYFANKKAVVFDINNICHKLCSKNRKAFAAGWNDYKCKTYQIRIIDSIQKNRVIGGLNET